MIQYFTNPAYLNTHCIVLSFIVVLLCISALFMRTELYYRTIIQWPTVKRVYWITPVYFLGLGMLAVAGAIEFIVTLILLIIS